MINYSLSYRTRYVNEGGTRIKKAFAYGKAQASGSMTTADFAKECCKTKNYSFKIHIVYVRFYVLIRKRLQI